MIAGSGDFGIYTEVYSREHEKHKKSSPQKYLFEVDLFMGKNYQNHKLRISFKGGDIDWGIPP